MNHSRIVTTHASTSDERPTSGPVHHRRRRRGSLLGASLTVGVAMLATVSTITPSSATATPGVAAPGDPTSPSDRISLSAKVKPGDPVPLALITEEADKEFGRKGFTGQGIDVALIDSGVTPVHGLDRAGKVLHGPDLSNEGALANLAHLDTYGHGTHLAGIIAGDDGDRVVGIAPGSRVVSLKVAGATGETDIAQVIAAIDWVVEHRNTDGLDIRVMNLSLGIGGIPTNVGDPLSAAVERAWQAGIVVVAAAGNRGNAANGVDSPAVSPYVIAVGATESYASKSKKDTVAAWSSGGNADRQPDVVAPGRSIMSLRVPGSMLDQLHPEAVVDDTYFLGSGTSQAAAVVTGYVAALLSRQPSLTPDQVKYLFNDQALDVDRGSTILDGHGRIRPKDVAREIAKASSAPRQNHRKAVPELASLEPLTTSASWSGGTWSGGTWSGGTWSGASWSGASWSGASWSAGTWSGASWSGASWSGASWSGASWSGASWSGASWSGSTWSSIRGIGLSGSSWS